MRSSKDQWISRFHDPNKSVQVTKKEAKAETPSSPRQMIQWAGALHSREDFNKRRDNLAQWTEVLFSH